MDKFQQDELTGRSGFEGFIKQLTTDTTGQPTTGKYDFVDGYIAQKAKKVVVEIKARSPIYATYPSHGIELDKYKNLNKAKRDNACITGGYVNFFGENQLYIYDLKKINTTDCKPIERGVPKTTAVDNGSEGKQFLDIPSRYAIRFERIDEKGTRI